VAEHPDEACAADRIVAELPRPPLLFRELHVAGVRVVLALSLGGFGSVRSRHELEEVSRGVFGG